MFAVRLYGESARLSCMLLLVTVLNASPSDQPKSHATNAVQNQSLPAEYLIGPDDMLTVNVWKEPEISRGVPVRPDGKISLPLIGDLSASGRTPVQLQNDIRERLLKYLSDPEVTVIVQEARSQKFNIIGEVERPGSYLLSKPMTVLDAIAVAGGFREFAKTTKIYVLRLDPAGVGIRLPFNYKKVVNGGGLDKNVKLEPLDTVVVP